MKNLEICIVKVIVKNDVEIQLQIKNKSLVAWSISEGRVDQRQILNFVRPY